ncbi:MAG: DUF1284 domain-containing protein [Methanobrevibacter sp.]|jgi:hypothetical protein|nr:DUF1284 domain-containing protein [Candidatus Methanovirga aequatorialis]
MFYSNKPIKLRAHHLLCLQGYQGYGYDENFKINLENVLNHLKTNPNVTVTKSADVICRHCPNLKDEKCCLNLGKYDNGLSKEKIENSNKEIIKMDSAVIKKMGIIENKSYNIDELYSDALKNVDDLKDICRSCIWTKECLWYAKNFKKSFRF